MDNNQLKEMVIALTKRVEMLEEQNVRFKKPTLEQVQAYCKERSNSVDAQAFIDHYETNKWMRGKNKIKCWKSCVRTWEKNSKSNNNDNSFLRKSMEF